MDPQSKKEPRGAFVDKLWREALRRQVLKRVAKQQNLDRLAAVVFSKAMEGDMVAAKEIAERIDGKVAQTHVGGDESDKPIQHVHRVELVGLRAG